jgi:putative transcriptional regulator
MNSEMTQQELADKIGVSRQTIIAIEKGAFNPSVKLALKMAKVFGVTVEALFSLDDAEQTRG